MHFKLLSLTAICCSFLYSSSETIINNSQINEDFAKKYLSISKDMNKSIAKSVNKKKYKDFADQNANVSKMDKYDFNSTEIKAIGNRDYTKNKDAVDISKNVYSEKFDKKLEAQKEYILKNVQVQNQKMVRPSQISPKLKHPYGTYKGVDVESNFNKKSGFTNDKHLFVVISSSMPKKQIKEYFKRADGNNDITFVLRGMIGGIKKIMPTRSYILDLVKKDEKKTDFNNVYKVNISINPKITKYYHIDKVPAFIYTENENETLLNPVKVKQDVNETFYVAYGLVDIAYAIDKINEKAKSEWLDKLLKRGRFY